MVTRSFETTIEVDVNPIWHNDPPIILYGFNNADKQLVLTQSKTIIDTDNLNIGSHCFCIKFMNKKDSDYDAVLGLDKQIQIGTIKIDGFTIPRFNWIAEYSPEYPEPWFSQQIEPPPSVHIGATILGWNGEWKLKIESPIFPWIHKIENMGWVWPV